MYILLSYERVRNIIECQYYIKGEKYYQNTYLLKYN